MPGWLWHATQIISPKNADKTATQLLQKWTRIQIGTGLATMFSWLTSNLPSCKGKIIAKCEISPAFTAYEYLSTAGNFAVSCSRTYVPMIKSDTAFMICESWKKGVLTVPDLKIRVPLQTAAVWQCCGFYGLRVIGRIICCDSQNYLCNWNREAVFFSPRNI